MPPVDVEPQEEAITESASEQIVTFMVNMLQAGYDAKFVHEQKAWEFALELASAQHFHDTHGSLSEHSQVDCMLQASLYLKDAYPLLAADSMRRQQEAQEAAEAQAHMPRIHRLN